MSLPIWGSVLWRRAIWAVMGSGLPDSACCFCCTPSRQPISVAPVNYSLPASTSGWTGSYRRPQACLIFTLLGGAVVCIGTALVDLFNRFLFSAKIVFLVIMLALLMPHIHQVNLLTLPVEQGLALSAIPVIFTSFGFHGSVPEHRQLSGGDIRKLRRVFIIGSFIPLVAYIFWQLATLGSIDTPAFTAMLANNAGLNGLLEAIREVVASPHVELAVHLFADLALATSFPRRLARPV